MTKEAADYIIWRVTISLVVLYLTYELLNEYRPAIRAFMVGIFS